MFSLHYFMLGIDTFVIARIKQIYLLHLCNIWGNALIYLYKLFFVIGFKKKNYIHFVFINFHYLNLCHSMLHWWHFYFYFYFYNEDSNNEDSNNKEPNLCIPGSTFSRRFPQQLLHSSSVFVPFSRSPCQPSAYGAVECVTAFLSVRGARTHTRSFVFGGLSLTLLLSFHTFSGCEQTSAAGVCVVSSNLSCGSTAAKLEPRPTVPHTDKLLQSIVSVFCWRW